MVETRPERRIGGRAWPVIAVAALAIVCLFGLAVTHLADPRAAFVFGLLIALCAAAVSLPRSDAAPLGTITPAPERATPFALMMETLGDPILLVSGADPDDFGDRKYIFANAAARDLLRLQRGEGPLTTAIRAPEVLAAVEEALFSRVAVSANWHSRGAQERFWQTRIVPLPYAGPAAETTGAARLALLTFHDETDIRRSESTRADFDPARLRAVQRGPALGREKVASGPSHGGRGVVARGIHPPHALRVG